MKEELEEAMAARQLITLGFDIVGKDGKKVTLEMIDQDLERLNELVALCNAASDYDDHIQTMLDCEIKSMLYAFERFVLMARRYVVDRVMDDEETKDNGKAVSYFMALDHMADEFHEYAPQDFMRLSAITIETATIIHKHADAWLDLFCNVARQKVR